MWWMKSKQLVSTANSHRFFVVFVFFFVAKRKIYKELVLDDLVFFLSFFFEKCAHELYWYVFLSFFLFYSNNLCGLVFILLSWCGILFVWICCCAPTCVRVHGLSRLSEKERCVIHLTTHYTNFHDTCDTVRLLFLFCY